MGARNKSEIAREVWLAMTDLVLDNQRRREVADAVGISFGRARAVRRVARKPMSMGELATALGMDRPNVSSLVNDLEDQGLVRRRAHPDDRRTRLVEATPKGRALADQANAILSRPPAALTDLGRDQLEAMRRMLGRQPD
jgi:DNA-binding MarR family transcriptional regulator